MRRYATPVAFKTAVEHRLRELAREQGREMNRLRQLMLFDRLLARVAAVFGDAAILKGGFALELRLGRARTTRDVDLRVMGERSNVIRRMREAARLELPDFLRFELAETTRTLDGPGMVYEGVRLQAQAHLASRIYGTAFAIDIAFGDPLSGAPQRMQGSSLLSFAGIEPADILVYPRESHVAEKLHAYTVPRPRENSRVKDLPDLALLATTGPFELTALRGALERTYGTRGSHSLPRELPPPPASWSAPYARMAQLERLPWRDIGVLTEAVRRFIEPVLHERRDARWSPSRWSWGGS